ncbi:MAG: DUF502 domain-containing protein [Gammaproteobacteria bacterium]|nr:DUF502 domain-containing protein [Gammaproteobacteria bacterium]
MKTLRKYLVAGLLIWVPLGITFLILKILIGFMDRSLLLLPEAYRPENMLGIHIPGLGLILTLTLLVVTGLLVTNLLGRKILGGWESLLARIPLIRSVYSGAKQVAETMFSEGGQSFKKVLLIPYPREGVWSLAFQTATEVGEVQVKTSREVLCVFVPTTPNPTSGFIVMVPRADVIELDMTVDAALRMIISLGVVVPEWRDPAQDSKLAPPPPRA